jgi:copper chaperone CopZ
MKTRQISFLVEGMYCARCAVELERALAVLDGVFAAHVNYASERAIVLCDPARVKLDALANAVVSAGFAIAAEEKGKLWALFGEHNPTQGVNGWKQYVVPALAGLLGGLALLGLYLGILALVQSPGHALEQLSHDRVWVGLVALGFGTQIGLYAYLRLVLDAMKLAGATVVTGAGTGTSTLGMLACCAHHLADLAPLVSVTSVSSLSGVIALLAEYKIPFLLFGLGINALGLMLSVRTIRREQAHLEKMERAAQVRTTAPAVACH